MRPFRPREDKTRCDKLATRSGSTRIEQVEPMSPTRPTLKTMLGQKPANLKVLWKLFPSSSHIEVAIDDIDQKAMSPI